MLNKLSQSCFIFSVLAIVVTGTILAIVYLTPARSRPTGCLHKDFGFGGTVCVCNDEHCDTIPTVEKVNSSVFLVYTSNKEGLRFDKQLGHFKDLTTLSISEEVCEKEVVNCDGIDGLPVSKISKAGVRKIIIKHEKVYQKVLGWGGSFTDSTGINIKSLNENLQNKLIRSYFSKDGLEYNLGRVPIGGTDFSTHGYTYLDTNEDDGNCPDPELTKFTLVEEDFKYKIPIINKAFNLSKELWLIGSSWTSPKWMKENKVYQGWLGYLKPSMYQAWANYYIKFLQAYKKENITFWSITTQNEPFFAMAQNTNNGLLFTPEEMRDWIVNNMGPTLRNSAFSDLKLLGFDDSRPILPHSLNTIFSEPKNLNYIDGISVHSYFDTDDNAYMLDDCHNSYPDKFLLVTESCVGWANHDVLLGSWFRGERLANLIIENLNHWVTGWIDWNMALDLGGGPCFIKNFVDAHIIVDAKLGVFYKQPMYYVLGHFSKFIPRDSERIYSTQCGSEVPVVAFKRPDGGMVVIVLNRSDEIKQISIMDQTRGEIGLKLSPRSISSILYW